MNPPTFLPPTTRTHADNNADTKITRTKYIGYYVPYIGNRKERGRTRIRTWTTPPLNSPFSCGCADTARTHSGSGERYPADYGALRPPAGTRPIAAFDSQETRQWKP
jgi:hypothetical protein